MQEGFIHGDLKPENILLSKEHNPYRAEHRYCPVIADFGCIQRSDAEPKQVRLGTGAYRDPIVRSGKYGEEIDVRPHPHLCVSLLG